MQAVAIGILVVLGIAFLLSKEGQALVGAALMFVVIGLLLFGFFWLVGTAMGG